MDRHSNMDQMKGIDRAEHYHISLSRIYMGLLMGISNGYPETRTSILNPELNEAAV